MHHLPADDLVLGVVVAPELEPVEEGDLAFVDVEGDVDDLVLGVEALDRGDLGVEVADVAVGLPHLLDGLFPDLGAVDLALLELDQAPQVLRR